MRYAVTFPSARYLRTVLTPTNLDTQRLEKLTAIAKVVEALTSTFVSRLALKFVYFQLALKFVSEFQQTCGTQWLFRVGVRRYKGGALGSIAAIRLCQLTPIRHLCS